MDRTWILKDVTRVGWLAVAVAFGFVGWTPSAMSQEALLVPAEVRGVVVEEVGEGSALEKAGLRLGDVVYAWERLPALPGNPEGDQGTIESVFDWKWLVIEQAPRGTVKLTGQRGGEVKVFEVLLGKWEVTVRAWMPEEMLDDYAKGRKFIEGEELDAGIDLWHKIAGISENQSAVGGLTSWLFLRIGDTWGKTRQWERAQGAYRSALETALDSRSQVAVLQSIGDGFQDASEFDAAQEAYSSALAIQEKTWGESLVLAGGLSDLGKLDWRRGKLDSVQAYFQRALEIRQKLAPGSIDVAASLSNLGVLASRHDESEQAAKYLERSLEITQELAPGSHDVAGSLHNLGTVAHRYGDLDKAAEYYERSLEAFQKIMSDSPDVAASLNNLGFLADQRGDLDQAVSYYEGALKIFQKLAPGSLDLAASLHNLGRLASSRGDFDKAEEYCEGAIEIIQELAPGSLNMAASLTGLGSLNFDRGDLDQAAEYYNRAMEILQKLAPDSLDVAVSLNDLGLLARHRGDLDRAAEYHKRALDIRKRLAPDSLDVAASLGSLGLLSKARGDLEQAAEYHQGALEINQKLAPIGHGTAASLGNLGILARQGGDLHQATKYYEKSLEIFQELARGGLDIATIVYNLGLIASDRGDIDQAVKYYEESLDILQKLAPGSSLEAEIYYYQAVARREQGQPLEALNIFLKALQSLDDQIARLGGSRDIQAGFRAERFMYYSHAISISLELQQPERAFHILERSRARSFLSQLAERDLVFSDLPEELGRQRRRIAHNYNRAQDEIAQLNSREQAGEIEILFSRLLRLRRDSEDVTEKIIKASPKLGALRYPKPVRLDAGRKTLDPGTVMLSYSIDEDETHIFVLTREGDLQVKTTPLGEKALQREVERILELQKRRSTPHLYTNPIHQAGERLYQALIQPAEDVISKSDRILIVPDGPLHSLPFALLVRKVDPVQGHGGWDFEYLVEWRPLHYTLSATVYAELRNQRQSKSTENTNVLSLVAFGDPRYSSEKAGDALVANRREEVHVRAAAERGVDFRPLPHSREEVNWILALYPEGAAHGFLGAKATEEQAKSIGKSARVLHFATHGRYDDRFPLNSYLAFTIPKKFQKDQDNGLLQAWEIFEDVRLDADLVVLSACESGLGEEVFGEGLKGLTRAFQFAGARTVAASLWKVEDRATAELMVRFYRYLQAGMPKDEALRAAQLELIRGPVEIKSSQGQIVERDFSAPYYWAAFQMIGDWQ